MKQLTEVSKMKLVVDRSTNAGQILPFPYEIQSCKRAFTTRNVNPENMKTLITGRHQPQAGDLVLCEVTKLRQHCKLEQPDGRRSKMFVKDKIIVCYGNRYAPDQFESIVPTHLDACHLVAGGGVASLMRHRSPSVKPATEIQPLGLIGDKHGQVLNLKNFSILNLNKSKADTNIPVILVSGSSMNAGKTTTVANVIKGLTADGYNVGAAKVTGTGSGGDLWHFIDSGVQHAIDFTDAGFVTTYLLSKTQLINTFNNMLMHLSSKDVDVIVIEVADGILQGETRQLLESKEVRQSTTAMIYTGSDSTSALYGANWLEQLGYNMLAISGVVSSNPLGKKEVEKFSSIPVLTKTDFTSAGFGHQLIDTLNSCDLVKPLNLSR